MSAITVFTRCNFWSAFCIIIIINIERSKHLSIITLQIKITVYVLCMHKRISIETLKKGYIFPTFFNSTKIQFKGCMFHTNFEKYFFESNKRLLLYKEIVAVFGYVIDDMFGDHFKGCVLSSRTGFKRSKCISDSRKNRTVYNIICYDRSWSGFSCRFDFYRNNQQCIYCLTWPGLRF